MSRSDDTPWKAGRLIQWGLQPRVRPGSEPEYGELVDAYRSRAEFRRTVDEFADGLGLFVLDVSDHGIVLSPHEDSFFRLRAADYRPSSTRVEDRLLDGLVHVAIATVLFPRPGDLDDDLDRPRPPVTVHEVEEHLRALADALAEAHKNAPDPEQGAHQEGLHRAWRIYHERYAVRETETERRGRRSTTGIIEYALERLRDQGCMVTTEYAGQPAWQPTRRFNVLVQELAASALYDEVQRALAQRRRDEETECLD
jgi:hypothetical protein